MEPSTPNSNRSIRELSEDPQNQLTTSTQSSSDRTTNTTSPTQASVRNVLDKRASSFVLPTLSPAGSVEDISRTHPHHCRQPTPPAALSSQGARLQHTSPQASSDMDQDYDFVDDASELSNDEHETASVASTEQDMDGVRTPDEDLIEFDDEAATATPAQVELPTIDPSSFLTEDLETPRQSVHPASVTQAVETENIQLDRGVVCGHPRPRYRHITSFVLFLLISTTTLPLILLGKSVFSLPSPSSALGKIHARQAKVSSAVSILTNSTSAVKQLNVSHIVPETLAQSSWLGMKYYVPSPRTAHFQTLPPNHIVVSLPEHKSTCYPRLTNVRATRTAQALPINQTELTEGIYALSISPEDAHGVVQFDLLAKCPGFSLTRTPVLNVSISYNFGNKMLQRYTYQTAGAELSKTVTKDLIVASQVARSFTERLQMDVRAGAVATKNVTTEIVRYIARDVALIAHSVAGVPAQLSKMGNQTAHAIRKEVATMSRDIAHIGELIHRDVATVSRFTKDLALSTKDVIVSPLKLSGLRVGMFKDKLSKRWTKKKGAKSACSVSLPGNKSLSKYVDSFNAAVRCMPAKDYKSCTEGKRAVKPDKKTTKIKERTRKVTVKTKVV